MTTLNVGDRVTAKAAIRESLEPGARGALQCRKGTALVVRAVTNGGERRFFVSREGGEGPCFPVSFAEVDVAPVLPDESV